MLRDHSFVDAQWKPGRGKTTLSWIGQSQRKWSSDREKSVTCRHSCLHRVYRHWACFDYESYHKRSTDKVRYTNHVNSLLSSCSSLLFALRVLRSRGLAEFLQRHCKTCSDQRFWRRLRTVRQHGLVLAMRPIVRNLTLFWVDVSLLVTATRAWRRSLTFLVMLMTHCSRVLTQTVAISFTNICLTGVTVIQYTT